MQRERKHAVVHHLADDADALPVFPHALWLGVDPGELGKGFRQALKPEAARLFVVVFHTAAGLQNLIRAHRGIAHKDQFVIFVVFAQDVHRREFFGKAAAVVFPHEVIDAVVEIVKLQMLELLLGGAEELFHTLDVFVHRAAHIHEQQHLDVVVALGAHANV